MKITFFSVLTLITIASCSKEDVKRKVQQPSSIEPTVVEEQNGFTGSRQDNMRRFQMSPDSRTAGCYDNYGNCFPDVVVTPSIAQGIGNVFDIIKTKDNAKILANFIENRTLLLSVLEEELYMNVLDEKYTVRHYPGTIKGIDMMMFLDLKSNKFVYAIPFK